MKPSETRRNCARPLAAAFLVMVTLLVAGCDAARSMMPSGAAAMFARGKELVEKGNAEAGLAELERAIKTEPRNTEYRIYLTTTRAALINGWTTQGDEARERNDFDAASGHYARVLRLEPTHDRALAGMDEIRRAVRHEGLVREASSAAMANRLEEAAARLRIVLSENPGHVEAQRLRRQVAERLEKATLAAGDGLGPAFRRPLTLEFRDANLRAIFDVLARTSGINFVFDRDVRPDLRATVFLRNTTIEDAMNILIRTNQLDRLVMNENTVLIYPNTPGKQKEYQSLVVRTFYLANADAKTTANLLRTIVRTRDIFIDEKLNMVTIRDTADAIRVAEKLVASQDLPEPEVVLELEVLEVNTSRLRDLGIVFPSQFTVLNIVPNPTTITTLPGGQTVTSPNLTTTTTQLTLDRLRGINSAQIGINNPQLNARAELGDSNILANPRIRVKNREKARVHIGDRVPVITTTSTANVGVSEAVNYLDVGIKLDVEPTIFLDSDVSIRVSLEVSSIVREVTSRTGTLTYQLGTRNASTVLRLRNNETQVLAGLISDEDRRSAVRIPLVGELPMVGRLFGTNRSDVRKSEVVLLMTPRVVRNVPAVESSVQEFPAGTESAVGSRALTVRPGASVKVPMTSGPAKPAATQPAQPNFGDFNAPSLQPEQLPVPVLPTEVPVVPQVPVPPLPGAPQAPGAAPAAPPGKPAAGAAVDPARQPLRFTDLRRRP
jgi:general secretion pathway protein D